MNGFIKKVSVSAVANFFVLFVSVFSTIIFPKVLSVSNYSYWQLYVFYTSYVTLAGFGITEGIYLINGGKKFKDLNSKILSFCTYLIGCVSVIVFLIIFLLSLLIIKDVKTKMVVLFTCINGIIFNLRVYPLYVLQATNRIKEFAISIFIGRLFFMIIAILTIIMTNNNLYLLMIADNLGCIVCSIYSYSKCKDKLLSKPSKIMDGLTNAGLFIKSGINLLIASLISSAILGVIKFAIKSSWNIIEFGKISLVLTFTNVFLKFATSIGQVLFPILCNVKMEHSKKIYLNLIDIVNIVTAVMFLGYYPAQRLLLFYLPAYSESIKYMSYLLPICIFEMDVSLIYNTYFKSLRREKQLMIFNFITLIVSLIFSFVFAVVIHSIFMCVLTVLIVIILRAVLLESFLTRREFKIKASYSISAMLITLAFIVGYGIITGITGFCFYFIFLCLYLICNRTKICKIVSTIKKHTTKEDIIKSKKTENIV